MHSSYFNVYGLLFLSFFTLLMYTNFFFLMWEFIFTYFKSLLDILNNELTDMFQIKQIKKPTDLIIIGQFYFNVKRNPLEFHARLLSCVGNQHLWIESLVFVVLILFDPLLLKVFNFYSHFILKHHRVIFIVFM